MTRTLTFSLLLAGQALAQTPSSEATSAPATPTSEAVAPVAPVAPVVAPVTEAPPPVEPAGPRGYHEHDGFYLRLTTGFGYGQAVGETATDKKELKYSGFCSPGSFGIGYAVAPNLIINADFFGLVFTNPTIEIDGKEFDYGDADVNFQLVGFGAGVTYYIMPHNIYVAGSVGISSLGLDVEGDGYEMHGSSDDPGPGVSVMGGKEWWVSDNWGLGVAAQFVYASVPPDKGDKRVNTFGGGLLFSATYN